VSNEIKPVVSDSVNAEATIDALYKIQQNHDHQQRLPNGHCTYCAGIEATIHVIDMARRAP